MQATAAAVSARRVGFGKRTRGSAAGYPTSIPALPSATLAPTRPLWKPSVRSSLAWPWLATAPSWSTTEARSATARFEHTHTRTHERVETCLIVADYSYRLLIFQKNLESLLGKIGTQVGVREGEVNMCCHSTSDPFPPP